MPSKNYISTDYLERRGQETKGKLYKGDSGNYGSVNTSDVVLGSDGLTRSYISSFNYNYVCQYFISKGVEEVVAKSMTLFIDDLAKVRNISVQEVLFELEREYTTKLQNPVERAKAVVVVDNEQISEIKIIDNGLGFYSSSPAITITGDGIGADASLQLDISGRLIPTINDGGQQYTYATAAIDKVQIIKDYQIYIPNHSYKTGDCVFFTPLASNEINTSLPYGLIQYTSDGKPKKYYIITNSNNHIKLAETEKDVRLNKHIFIGESVLDGGFIINRTFNFNLGTDSYIYLNGMRSNTKQMMGVTPAKTSDISRSNRLLP